MSIPELLNSGPAIYKYVDGDEKLVPVELAINHIIFKLAIEFNQPIRQAYSVTQYYINGFLNKKSITEAYRVIAIDILDSSSIISPYGIEHRISKIIFDGINTIYNDIALESKEYEASTLLSDALDIQLDPGLLSKIDTLKSDPHPSKVRDVFSRLEELMRDKKNKNNTIVMPYLSETVSSRQTNQCLGSVGFAVDLNNRIYQSPIASSYCLGLNDIRDVAKESRGAAIALKNSTEAITQSETFSRETQMLTSVIEDLTREDCGSTVGFALHIKPADGESSNGIKGIVGQMYKLSSSEDWKTVKEGDSFLENQTIILRTALSCQLKDSKQVCIACFGKTGRNMPSGFNIGHWSSSKMNEPANQSLLSAKHYIASADGGAVKLTGEDDKYLKIDKENRIRVALDLRKWKTVNIRVPEHGLSGLKNIRNQDSLLSAEIWNISNVKEFTLELIPVTGERILHKVNLTRESKIGIFSSDFISHIIEKGYTLDNNEYIIPFKGYNVRKPIVLVPDVVFDFRKYNEELRKLLQTTKSRDGVILKTSSELLKALYHLINIKLYTHIAPLSVIAYAMTAANKKEGDYSLTRGIDAPIETIKTLLNERTQCTAIAYGKADTIFKTLSTLDDDSEDHMLAALFDPGAVMKEINMNR